MTEAEQKKLNGFLSKTLKMDDEELASLYNEAGELTSLTAAEKADTSRVAKLKEENDSQYKRGQKEVATKFETKLKEKYGVSSDETGIDLVDLILTTELEKVKGKGGIVDSIYGDLDYVDWRETKKIVRKWRAGKHTWKSFRYGWHPPHPTFFVKRDLYDRLGNFREDLKIVADYELMLRFIYVNKITMSYLPKVLVKMRDGGASSSGLAARKTTYIEDARGWSFNNLQPSIFALTMKRVRKLVQWHLLS